MNIVFVHPSRYLLCSICLSCSKQLYDIFSMTICWWFFPDSKVHGANMGPTWVLSAPDRPHGGPMNLVIRVSTLRSQLWPCYCIWYGSHCKLFNKITPYFLTRCSIMENICVSECLISYSTQSHYLKSCWIIIKWALSTRLQIRIKYENFHWSKWIWKCQGVGVGGWVGVGGGGSPNGRAPLLYVP